MCRALACLMTALALAGPARAHDTWFHIERAGPAPLLSLGTGQRFPVHETAIAPEYLARQGCRPGNQSGDERPMRPAGYRGTLALRLRAAAPAHSCWVQLVPLQVEVPAAKVDGYLHEIRAGATTLAAWQAQRRQGLPWQETYTKHARVDLAPGPVGPVAMGMDLVRVADGRLQVLRDGLPLAGLAVELVNADAPFGIWRRSDAQGFIELGPLPQGRWLARAVDLRPVEQRPGHWDSRFVTLLFQVVPEVAAGLRRSAG